MKVDVDTGEHVDA